MEEHNIARFCSLELALEVIWNASSLINKENVTSIKEKQPFPPPAIREKLSLNFLFEI